MADTNINQGNFLRFENGGIARITPSGGSDYAVAKILPGSLSMEFGYTEGVTIMDRGSLSTTVLDGDERPSKISFTARLTKLGMTAANELLSVLNPAASGGVKVLFRLQIDVPDAKGGAAGTRYSFASCFLVSPPKYKAGGSGNNPDEISFEIESRVAAPTISTY